ncbi:17985_t:CDS:2, partial [Funneliformis geosporum]
VAVPNKRRQKKDPVKTVRLQKEPVNDQEQPVVEKDTADRSRSTNF